MQMEMARTQKDFIQKNLTISGEVSAPTPNSAWEKGIHDPAFYADTYSMQMLIIDTIMQLLSPRPTKVVNYPILDYQDTNKMRKKAQINPDMAVALWWQVLLYLWIVLRMMSPRIPPMVLAVNSEEYQVYGLFLAYDRKGMTGPIIPSPRPILKSAKEYMARYILGCMLVMIVDIFVNIMSRLLIR